MDKIDEYEWKDIYKYDSKEIDRYKYITIDGCESIKRNGHY